MTQQQMGPDESQNDVEMVEVEGIPLDWISSEDPEVLKDRLFQYQEALDRANSQRDGEAPGLAWMKLYTKKGAEITISVREPSATIALDQLVKVVAHAYTKYGMTSVRPAANPVIHYGPDNVPVVERPGENVGNVPTMQAPVAGPLQNAPTSQQPPAAAAGDNVERITIAKVAREVTKNGQDSYLRVFGGKYTKYGVPAYEEVIPAAIAPSFKNWPVKAEYAPPPGLKVAVIRTEGDGKRKVISFEG